MTRCLVTGGAGFIGSHLTERLLERGDEVVVLDDLSTGQRGNLNAVADHPRLRVRLGSVTDASLLAELVPWAETVYHLAAAVGVQLVADDPVHTIETNVSPTGMLLKLASTGPRRFFLASTSEVYGKNPKERWDESDDLLFGPTTRPRWAYGVSKAIDEFLALAYCGQTELKAVVGRFFNVVGPRQVGRYGMVIPRFVDQALAGEPLTVYDDGGQTRCFGHVREVVDCVIALTESDDAVGEVVNIGSDRSVTIRELAEQILSLTDPDLPLRFLDYDEAYGQNFEDVRRRVPDLSRLGELIGESNRPSASLTEILRDIIAWKRAERERAAGDEP